MPFINKLDVYSSNNKPCPTAAEACLSAIFVGRFLNPNEENPAAIAPEETKINSCPSSCKVASCCVIALTFARDKLPSEFVNELVPTLKTILLYFIVSPLINFILLHTSYYQYYYLLLMARISLPHFP